ncbi:hypothetical protein MF406_10880 [Georgenia sp. TF02-10]|uniref:hypothetical protein n=1 Tax=Georgenia sp. TF02-10 TaxID=2917725 RepID=UPI001FA6A9B0|nr:hypothetical protein [Georgenia sp. TF02-10]UNX53501.1 hypothetical protein MF406_10880 [Georgenia sp. TF02-10]
MSRLAPARVAVGTSHHAMRAALIALFVVLLVALTARTIATTLEPPFDGSLSYDDVQLLGETYWPLNLYLNGPGYAVSWVATAIFLVLLARGRTAPVTVAAGFLAGTAGILFALVVTAEALPFALALTDPEPDARARFDMLNEGIHVLVPTIIATQLAIAVAMLAALVCAFLSRALPRWVVVVGVVYIVVFVGLPVDALGRWAVIASYLLQVALVVCVGWFGLKEGLRRSAGQTTELDRPALSER